MSSTDYSSDESFTSETSSEGRARKLKAKLMELAGCGAALAALAASRRGPVPTRPIPFQELTGRQWVEANLLNEVRCFDNFRMYPNSFKKLHHILVNQHGLRSTREVDSVEALGMFLWVCATNQPVRQIRDRFQRGLGTISKKMGEVADAMFSYAQSAIAVRDPNYTRVHHRLNEFQPYFDGCIGALDGTHVSVKVSRKSRLDFINRKNTVTVNVLGIVDMDMHFTYVGAGRPGSYHDMAVLNDCMDQPNFPHPPPGRYYLVDAGYAWNEGFLGPYRHTRYHLDDFRRREAEGYKEKFNYHHSRLRNVIERAFGRLKGRWHILEGVPNYLRQKQVKIIIACFALHNFCEGETEERADLVNMERPVDYEMSAWAAAIASADMAQVRDWIAMGIWAM